MKNLFVVRPNKVNRAFIMRIGILTHFGVTNEGAILQAYALSQTLRERFLGHHVEIVNYRTLKKEMYYFTRPFVKGPRGFLRDMRRYMRLRRSWKRALPLSPRRLITNHYSKALNFLMGRYDLLITGSDVVWQVARGRWANPFPNIFWLPPELQCKKVAYAASADRTDIAALAPDELDFMRACLQAFDLIGVRDRLTQQLVDRLGLTNRDRVQSVPDPTFLYEFQGTDVQKIMTKAGLDLSRPILGMALWNRSAVESVLDYCRKRGWQTVSLSFRCGADVDLSDRLTPFEWAEAFKYFRFFAGHLFHGTVFALKSNCPFITLEAHPEHQSAISKMRSLLLDMGMEQHVLAHAEYANSPDIISDRIESVLTGWDSASVSVSVEEMRRRCEKFIEQIAEILES